MKSQHRFKARRDRQKNRQQGAVLVAGLMMLLIMTIIGVSSMQSTNMEEKMAGNARDRDVAFQAAESALRQGEASTAKISEFTFDGTNGNVGLYERDATIDVFNSASWTTAKSLAYAGTLHAGSAVQLASGPRLVLQYRGAMPVDAADKGLVKGTKYGSSAKRHVIRVYALGSGLTTNTQVLLQSDAIVLR